jgi:hypothetical protein
MTKKYHSDIIAEYGYLKHKATKLAIKAEFSNNLPKQRIIRKIRQLVKRMVELEHDCKQMGYGHPDAFLEEEKNITEQDFNRIKASARILLKPDGTLPGNVVPLPMAETTPIRGMSNPDGTLFETPKLEGSVLPRRGEEE